MDKKKAKAVLEAILFTMGDSVEIDRLAAVIEDDKDTTVRLLEEMAADYQKADDSGQCGADVHEERTLRISDQNSEDA